VPGRPVLVSGGHVERRVHLRGGIAQSLPTPPATHGCRLIGAAWTTRETHPLLCSLPHRPLPRAQLLGRKPLFPGKNFVHQLSLIFDVIGAPRSGEVAHITNKQARKFLQGVQGKVKVPFERLYPSAPPLVIGLLESSLAFEPNDRLSAREALKHPYFAPFEPEKEVEPPIHPDFNFNFEHQQLPKAQLKGMILEEVSSFRREVRGDKRASSGVESNEARADGHAARERSRERPSSSSAAPRASSASRAHSRTGGDRPDPYKAA
jgi:serine/threonine protein kinase